MRVLTEILPSPEAGYYYYWLTFISFVSVFAINPWGMLLLKNFKRLNDASLLFAALARCFVVLAVTSILISFYLLSYSSLSFLETVNILGMFISASAFFFMSPIFNLLHLRTFFVFYLLANSTLSLICSLVLSSKVAATGSHWILGVVFGNVFSSIVMWFHLGRVLRKRTPIIPLFSFRSLKSSLLRLRFTVPVSICTGFYYLIFSGYKIIIEKISGLELLGVVSIAVAIPISCFSICESFVNQHYAPHLYNVEEEHLNYSWLRFLCISTVVYILTFVFCVVNSHMLLRLLVAEKYHSYSNVLSIGAMIECGRAIGNSFYIYSQLRGGLLQSIKSYIVAFIVLLLSLVLFRYNNFGISPEYSVLMAVVMSSVALVSLFIRNLRYVCSCLLFSRILFVSAIVSVPLLVAGGISYFNKYEFSEYLLLFFTSLYSGCVALAFFRKDIQIFKRIY